MNSKEYTVTFQLWNITDDESTGDLLRESPEVVVSPLTSLGEDAIVFLTSVKKFFGGKTPQLQEPIDIGVLRVSMTRNNGQGIIRQRIEHGEKLFRLDIRATRKASNGLLQECYTKFTTSKRPYVELQCAQSLYWVIVNWHPRKGFEPPEKITGTHPLTGTPSVLELEDVMDDDTGKGKKALYALPS